MLTSAELVNLHTEVIIAKEDVRADAYATPCGRYSVERNGAERFEVYGPAGFIEWFVSLADAKECADGQAQANPVKPMRRIYRR